MRRNKLQKTLGPLTKYTTVIQEDRKKRKAWVSANPHIGGITSLEMLR